jgi:hypothetical protein
MGGRMDEAFNSSQEWALEIFLERFKADLIELLREHSADEVIDILAQRRWLRSTNWRESDLG